MVGQQNSHRGRRKKKLTKAEAEALDSLLRLMKRFKMKSWFEDLKKRAREARSMKSI